MHGQKIPRPGALVDVHLINAKDLPIAEKALDSADPVVTLRYGRQVCKTQQRTAAGRSRRSAWRAEAPVWRANFQFELDAMSVCPSVRRARYARPRPRRCDAPPGPPHARARTLRL